MDEDKIYTCSMCKAQMTTLDEVPNHSCFNGLRVFCDEEGFLFSNSEDIEVMEKNTSSDISKTEDTAQTTLQNSEKPKVLPQKQSAAWSSSAVLALLEAYESRTGDDIRAKKETKFWDNLAKDLQETGHMINGNQARWKFSALLRRYKQIESIQKTGRGVVRFPWFDQMESILRKRRNVTCTVTSMFLPHTSSALDISRGTTINRPLLPKESSTDISKRSPRAKDSTISSTLTENKLEFERQLRTHLKILDETNEEKDGTVEWKRAIKEEELRLKMKMVELRERELLWREKVTKKKLEQMDERLSIDREICRLLTQILANQTSSPSYE
ncbi:uncharacterized protein LOC105695229 isoform X2 [Orussus abietinus]|uniref:uncharacterized protein LOC105695229 isoform X2 n=1 Tax=Orussus abietinus TaxID=222816 RepID=UPI0006257ADD|nr:uncharacterized protein LOC105695229 isoform X2 [Orussus abietinus]